MKKLLVAVLAITAFMGGYGMVTHAWPWFGRNEYYGYFANNYDAYGTYVLPILYDGGANAVPNSINTPAEFISFIMDDYNNGTTQEKKGADFIIDTMLGGDRVVRPSATDIAQWQSNVNFAANNGWVTWSTSFSHNYNSYYQATGTGTNPNDDAFYDNVASSTAITFKDSTGQVKYGIRRQCANPVGNAFWGRLEMQDYSITGHTTVSDNTPYAGDTITFSHFVKNNGPDTTAPRVIYWVVENMPSAAVIGGPTNGGTFASNQEKPVFTHAINILPGTPGGTQYCERVGYDPTNDQGGVNGRGATVCATVQANYTLTPTITPIIGGAASGTGVTEVGDTLSFEYRINNTVAGGSASVNCNIVGKSKVGYQAVPTPYDSVSDPGFSLSTGCPRTFPGNTNTLIQTEPVTLSAATANTSICRSLFVNPATPGGGQQGTEVCVYVTTKPYVKVFGGDLSAGNGFTTSGSTCTSNSNAAIVGWNRRGGAPDWSGAGTQYAAFALYRIQDFASSQGTAAGVGAPRPSGLVFGNNSVDTANGYFGGNFGSASCIRDYYSGRPASTTAIPADISTMTTGIYGATGNTYFGGTSDIGPSERITVYVDGNVYINSNVRYTGSWNSTTIPGFQLIVRGDIYIDTGVSQLDGLYVAQPNGGSGGTIYTCALTSPALFTLPTTANLASQCDNTKLTVNGAFIANQVRLMRTSGSVIQATNGETGAANTAAEVFNYGPYLWMSQPPSTVTTPGTYDSITTLPPVL